MPYSGSTRKLSFLLLIVFGFSFTCPGPQAEEKKSKKVLIFSKTNGYRHKSIEAGIAAIKKLGEANQFSADATEDSLKFTAENLKQYNAVIFLSPTGDVLNEDQQNAFENYIKKGGGFVGIHAATDCEYKWPWYGKLVGAYFLSHPKQQKARLTIVDSKHASTKHLPQTWERFDEWYNFKEMNPDVKVLLTIDETSYEGGKNGANHPMAWYHKFEGGKAFYTELGHTDESYSDAAFLKHVLGGIEWAMK